MYVCMYQKAPIKNNRNKKILKKVSESKSGLAVKLDINKAVTSTPIFLSTHNFGCYLIKVRIYHLYGPIHIYDHMKRDAWQKKNILNIYN